MHRGPRKSFDRIALAAAALIVALSGVSTSVWAQEARRDVWQFGPQGEYGNAFIRAEERSDLDATMDFWCLPIGKTNMKHFWIEVIIPEVKNVEDTSRVILFFDNGVYTVAIDSYLESSTDRTWIKTTLSFPTIPKGITWEFFRQAQEFEVTIVPVALDGAARQQNVQMLEDRNNPLNDLMAESIRAGLAELDERLHYITLYFSANGSSRGFNGALAEC